jgi:hypothetical protein
MHLVFLANSHISHLEKSIVSEMSAGLKVVFASGTPTGGLWKSTIIKTEIFLNFTLVLPNYGTVLTLWSQSWRETNSCHLPVLGTENLPTANGFRHRTSNYGTTEFV